MVFSFTTDQVFGLPFMQEPEILPLKELRAEIAPCISPSEVADLCNQAAMQRRKAKQKSSLSPIILDIRTRDEYPPLCEVE